MLLGTFQRPCRRALAERANKAFSFDAWTECGNFSVKRQQFEPSPPEKFEKRVSMGIISENIPVVVSWLRRSLPLLTLVLWAIFSLTPSISHGGGPLIDNMDSQPLGWKLSDADCPVEIRAHWLDPTGGLDRRPCEAMSIAAGNGTQIILEYRIDPAHLFDEFKATVSAQSVREGVRIGLRIRYPRVIDPSTRAPLQVFVWGHTHRGRNQWEMLSVSPEVNSQRVREMAIRNKHGSGVDLHGAYVDAIVINAYTGTGASTVRLDNLRVDGIVPIEPSGVAARSVSLNGDSQRSEEAAGTRVLEYDGSAIQSAFPAGRVTRILEYNGESLEYLKLLGFDAVLLGKPPTAELLRGAMHHSITVFAPAPTAPDPAIEPFLAPVAGWYLGTSYDESQLKIAAQEEKRIAALPTLWRRPVFIAPAEAWAQFAGVATSIVYDMPLATRGLDGSEESQLLLDQVQRTGRPIATAVGIATQPPQRLVNQLDGLSRVLGATEITDYGWHALYQQVARSLVIAPRAIVYRSSRSLASGNEADSQRALALGYINRWILSVGPMLQDAQFRGMLRCNDERYQAIHLATPQFDLVIAVLKRSASDPSIAAPSAAPLQFRLPFGNANVAWRMTDTTAQQLPMSGDATSQSVTIESPDLVEWILTSNDPGLGGRLDRVLRTQAMLMNQERWQLATDSAMRARDDWSSAMGGGLIPRTAYPSDMLRVAAEQLASVQPHIGAQRWSAAMSATRSADLLIARSNGLLRSRLQPANVPITGMPTLLAPGGTQLQLAWLPSLEDGNWTNNLLAGGDLENSQAMLQTGWTYQKRLENLATTAVGVDPLAGEFGTGALRIESMGLAGEPLPGGYAGTTARVRSAAVAIPVGSWIRVEVKVKTLGFGGPHQGLLIYDSDAGSEVGTLIRGDSGWRTVKIYRVITADRPLRVTAETLGAGEALIDSVSVSMWQPPATPAAPFFPIVRSDDVLAN
jgi:hypothetical protein